jgi:Enhancer of rudimentary
MNYIILVQSTSSIGSRLWETFQTEQDMLQALISWFEDDLRQRNRQKATIDYTVKDFLDYLDKMKELVCLS